MIKKITSIVASILLVVGIVYGIFYIIKLKNAADEALKTAKFYRERPVEVVSVVRDELKVLYPYLDSLIEAAGLNKKHVETITNIYHEYKWDTVPAIVVADSGMQLLNVKMSKDCFDATGIIDFSKTDVKLKDTDVENVKFYLTGVTVTDTTTTVYYYSRKIKKIFFLSLRIGRKQYFSETFSKCNAKTQTESINLIKR
jgi:hypothetical protein